MCGHGHLLFTFGRITAPKERAVTKVTETAGFDWPERRTKREGYPMQGRIWVGILIGSTIGGFIPELWGADLFSYSAVLLSGVGALVGLFIGYKLA
jgi:uncharacterized membrane protein YeaQ/YmgE (transglycosylase-associated protein family)